MQTEQLTDHKNAIGLIAGAIWRYLDDNGPVTLSQLTREIDAPRDVVMQGLGWLARENQIRFEVDGRTKRVALG